MARKFKLTWRELELILVNTHTISPDEEIKGMTLVKPKELLIYAERK